jgi:hypothetical protein
MSGVFHRKISLLGSPVIARVTRSPNQPLQPNALTGPAVLHSARPFDPAPWFEKTVLALARVADLNRSAKKTCATPNSRHFFA